MDFQIRVKLRQYDNLYQLTQHGYISDDDSFRRPVYSFSVMVITNTSVVPSFRIFDKYNSIREAMQEAYCDSKLLISKSTDGIVMQLVPHPMFDSDLEYFEVDGYRVRNLEFLNFI